MLWQRDGRVVRSLVIVCLPGKEQCTINLYYNLKCRLMALHYMQVDGLTLGCRAALFDFKVKLDNPAG